MTEFENQTRVTRLQLGNEIKNNNPMTKDNPNPKSEISLETILAATSIIIVMRWLRQRI